MTPLEWVGIGYYAYGACVLKVYDDKDKAEEHANMLSAAKKVEIQGTLADIHNDDEEKELEASELNPEECANLVATFVNSLQGNLELSLPDREISGLALEYLRALLWNKESHE